MIFMGSRISIETFDELVNIGRKNLLDGIIKGVPLGETVGAMLTTASAFGGDWAERSDSFHATVDAETFEDLHRDMVEVTLDYLFSGATSMRSINRTIMTAGAAFGFKNIRKAMAERVAVQA
jgi:hypothetical protein